jgi:SAM-dependent methyltransferase/methyltransferase-like protein
MADETQQIRSFYDTVPYVSGAFIETHPDRLRTVAALAGIRSTVPVTECRVLEIGCGVGRNLIPMAQSLARSRFIGIDLSPRQIEVGRSVIAQLGLTNIDLRCQDLKEFSDFSDGGGFDYIIAHGVYSWVPVDVRDALLQLYSRGLSPHGIGYISYSALPGEHLQQVVRDLMLRHCNGETDPVRRVAKAREMIALAAEPSSGWAAYRNWLGVSTEFLSGAGDWYLLHDDLAPVKDGVYFEEFARQLGGAGLRYVGDARPVQELYPQLSPAIQEQARQMAGDHDLDDVRLQQYLDFLECRTYRAAVFCRNDISVQRMVDRAPTAMAEVTHLSVAGRIVEAQPKADQNWRWQFPLTGAELTVKDAPLAAALRRLASAWPHAVPFAELLDVAREATDGAEPATVLANKLADAVLNAYWRGMLELWSRPTDFLARNPDRPRVTPLAMAQLRAGDPVTNLRHQQITITDTIRAIVPLLDGTRTRQALAVQIGQAMREGKLNLPRETNVAVLVGQMLDECAINSLLIA